MMDYDRTVLVVGRHTGYRDHILKLLNKDHGRRYRLPACAREVVVNHVRYVHVCTLQEVRGYRTDETTYLYVGPHWHEVEAILLECRVYESEAAF